MDVTERFAGAPAIGADTLPIGADIHISRTAYLSLAVVLYFCCYFGLGAYGLLNNNEGLYAELGREVLRSHSFIIPTLDYVPYIEKPPLLYWLLAASYWLFGVSTTSARLVPATAAMLLCLGIVHFGRCINRTLTGIVAACVLASSLGFALLARTVMFDMLLTLFIAFSLLYFYRWFESYRSRELRLSYLFLGLAIMTKGLVALVLVPLTAIFFLLWTDRTRLRSLFDRWGIATLLLVTAPWHVAAALSDPTFAWYYFINEHVLRFLGLRKPDDFRTGPLYYYVPLVMAGSLPWTAWLGLAFRRRERRPPLEKLLLVWFVVFFVFFSLSRAKATYYLVTALPAAALFAALQIEHYATKRESPVNAICAFAGLAAAVLLSSLALLQFGALPGPGALLDVDIATVALVVLGTAASLKARASPQNRTLFLVASLSGIVVPFVASVVISAGSAQDRYSAASFTRAIASKIGNHEVLSFRDFEEMSSLLFYLRRPLPIVDSASRDLHYGLRTTEGKAMSLTSKQVALRQETKKVYMVVRAARLREFQSSRLGGLFHRVDRVGNLLLFRSNGPWRPRARKSRLLSQTAPAARRRTSRAPAQV